MARPVVRLQGSIQSLRFNGQPTQLPTYNWDEFNINTARPACKVRLANGTEIALSKWTGPKRTRTYPLAKVYDTYSHGGKVITVIPILKDEGKGEQQNDTNLDRVNFITLSWMNLMGVYVILAWYCDADKKDDYRITRQRLDNDYVRQKIEQIAHYKMDAHHWNRDHFVNFLAAVRSEENPDKLCLEKYAVLSLAASESAALRESATEHLLEHTQAENAKGFFEIRNYLGGVYYLTADEVLFESDKRAIIQESKNSTKHSLPSLSDIKDGLFKLLLYSQLQELRLNGTTLEFETRLRITGKFQGTLQLPTEEDVVSQFAHRLGKRVVHNVHKLKWLNEELRRLGIIGILEGNDG